MGETTNPISFLYEEQEKVPLWMPQCTLCKRFVSLSGRGKKNRFTCCGSPDCKRYVKKMYMQQLRAQKASMVR